MADVSDNLKSGGLPLHGRSQQFSFPLPGVTAQISFIGGPVTKQTWETLVEYINIAKGSASNRYTEQAQMMLEMLFARFCPWKPGDRVVLIREIDFERSPGCAGHEHWMQPGALGRVVEVGARDKRFTARVVFDESWIDRDGVVQAVSEKHSFLMWEGDIRVVAELAETEDDLLENGGVTCSDEGPSCGDDASALRARSGARS